MAVAVDGAGGGDNHRSRGSGAFMEFSRAIIHPPELFNIPQAP